MRQNRAAAQARRGNPEALEFARSLGISVAVNIIADPGWDAGRFDILREWWLQVPEIVNISINTPYPGTESWFTEDRRLATRDYRSYTLLNFHKLLTKWVSSRSRSRPARPAASHIAREPKPTRSAPATDETGSPATAIGASTVETGLKSEPVRRDSEYSGGAPEHVSGSHCHRTGASTAPERISPPAATEET